MSSTPAGREAPAFWPQAFSDRFELLGTLGGGRVCRTFLARARDRDQPLVAEWYFAHKHPDSSFRETPADVASSDSVSRGLVLPIWSGACLDGSWLGVRSWAEESLALPLQGALAEDLARWMAQLALALGSLHALGRLHGYVRPDLFLLDEKRNALLALGPVLTLDQPAPSSCEPEPMWSSPERLQGRPLGPASDLYSLGAAFYRLATGRLPFASTGADLVRDQISKTVRSPLLHNPRIGLPMAKLLDRLLRKDPNERFQSANDLIQGINRLLGTSYPIETGHLDRPRLRPPRWIEPAAASAAIADAVESARRGTVGLVVLEGEEGVGKRELLARLRASHADFTWIEGSARPRSEPFAAVLEVLSTLRGAPRLTASPREEESPESRLRPSRRGRQEIFRWALDLLGRHLPAVLVIESAELLDLPSMDLLCHLLIRSDTGGLLVILSQHKSSTAAPIGRYVSRLGAVQVRWVSLPRQSAEQSAELVRSMTGEPLHELEEFLFTLARGNPGSTSLLLHALVSSGALRPKQGHWSLDRDAVRFTSIADALRERVDALAPEERSVLHALDVLERPAAPEEVLALVDAAASVLAQLEAARLILRRDSRVWFVHAELARQARSSLSGDDRRSLHRRAFELLLARHASSEELAHHALGCAAHAAAARHLLEAGAQRAQLYDVARAADLYQEALDLVGSQDSDARTGALRHLGFLCLLLGRGQDAERLTRQALELTSSTDQKLALLDQLGRVHIRAGAYDKALETFDLGLALASDDVANRARFLAEKGWLCMRSGRAGLAEQLLNEALTLAENSGDPELREMRHAFLGRLAWSRGDLQEALGHFVAAVAAAEQQGRLEEVAIETINLATLHINLGHGSAVPELCDKVLRLTEQTGDLYEESRVLNLLGIHYSEQGLPARAITCYQKALDDAEQISNAIMIATVCINLGGLYKDSGDLERGLAALLRAQQMLASCQNRNMLAEARSALAELQLSLGNTPEAEEAIRAALELRRTGGPARGQAMDLYWLGRVLQERGQFEAARHVYAEALELAEGRAGSSFEPHALLRVALAESLLEAGRPAQARDALARAEIELDSHHLSGPSFHRWMARCRLDSGPEARVAADRAIAVAEHLKSPELLALAYAAAGECELAAGNRSAAVRFLQDAARGLRGLAERIQDPGLRARFLSTRRRHEILSRASELSVPPGPEAPFIRT